VAGGMGRSATRQQLSQEARKPVDKGAGAAVLAVLLDEVMVLPMKDGQREE